MPCRPGIVRAVRCLALTYVFALLSGCATLTSSPFISGVYSGLSPEQALKAAMAWDAQAPSERDPEARSDAWMRCAVLAHDAMSSDLPATREAGSAVAARCSRWYFETVTQGEIMGVHPGSVLIGHRFVRVEFRGLPDSLGTHIYLEPADQVPVDILGGIRHQSDGFGVPLVAFAPTCTDRPICTLYPPEGIFRPATFWLEGVPDAGHKGEAPLFVIQYPVSQPEHLIGSKHYPLAEDLSAPYAQLLERTNLRRLGWWGLVGGKAVGLRSGVFLLDDYDPDKMPIIMIHGLGSSPIIWARLSNAIFGDSALHQRYQIWHVVYQTNAPLLVERRRVQGYLDATWKILDPGDHAPARTGEVLIGHSLGGVIARLLCARSTPALWSAAFLVPWERLRGRSDDLALLKSVFQFEPYPGVDEAIFMAAPQHGSPAAGYWYGRVAQSLAWGDIPELAVLSRIANENSPAIPADLLANYRIGRLSSISSLLPDQPVSLVDEQLMPVSGVRYHTIAGVLAGQRPPGDGFVPLSSALIPGAASTLIVHSNHRVPNNPEAIAAVLKILRDHAGSHLPDTAVQATASH